jgi:hypothetical protein
VLGAAAKAKAKEGQAVHKDVRVEEEDWIRSGSSPPSEFDAEDMDRYFRTRDELASVAESEPAPFLGPASLAYDVHGLWRGHERAQMRGGHHARVPENGEAYYSRRRHAYAHRE